MRNHRRMRLAPEGGRIIALSAIMVVLAAVFSLLRLEGSALWLPAVTAVWFLMVVLFFRDPEVRPPDGENLILSPANGLIVSVGDAVNSPLDPNGQRVAIFMSVMDVHVNRSPFAGVVENVEHNVGKFISALKPSSSLVNEHTVIRMDTARGKIAFKQIAGLLARRIVIHPKSGDRLKAGERVGMIKFGSRVEVFLPDSANIIVRLGDRVVAGETIIGEFPDA